MMKHVLPLMKKQKLGLILNVNSGVAKRTVPHWGPYAVSKAGLLYLTLLTAAEMKGTGVRVNSVNPGKTRTKMRALAYPHENPKTLPSPEKVAPLFVWLTTKEAENLNGAWIEYQDWKLRKI